MNRSFTTKEVKATGHTLYIENTFKFNEEVLMEVLNKYLNHHTSYKIVSSDGRNFYEMSPGWKSAILLDLILGYDGGNSPIIIDQPEDNLAVKYINEALVQTIKKVKYRKQVILVSHNATIPMMADAQTIVLWWQGIDQEKSKEV